MKLSLDALKERAEATASTELLATINGGTENSCHTEEPGAFQQLWDAFWGGVGEGLKN